MQQRRAYKVCINKKYAQTACDANLKNTPKSRHAIKRCIIFLAEQMARIERKGPTGKKSCAQIRALQRSAGQSGWGGEERNGRQMIMLPGKQVFVGDL